MSHSGQTRPHDWPPAALREVCVTIPEATVPEFERKVNELMLVSLSLTGRPKRRKAGARTRQANGAWAK